MSRNRKLREIAAILPPLPKLKNGKPLLETVRVQATGKEILEKQPDFKLRDGSAPLPGKTYTVLKKVPVMMNHLEVMLNSKQHGIEALNQYIDLVYQYNQPERPINTILI